MGPADRRTHPNRKTSKILKGSSSNLSSCLKNPKYESRHEIDPIYSQREF